MNTRRIHRIGGIILAPFFFWTAINAALIVLGHDGLLEKNTVELLVSLHNYNFLPEYVNLILPAGVLFMAITGVSLLYQFYSRKKPEKEHQREAPGTAKTT